MHAKKTLSVLILVGLGGGCWSETNAQEPIPLFEFEDKEPQAPDLAQDLDDPGPPVHPTAPPPKPTPLVFGPGKLPWAPQGYTVHFHLREEAEWTAKYDGKFWKSGKDTLRYVHGYPYLQKNMLKFTPAMFLSENAKLFPLNKRVFESVLLPDGFWNKDKSMHFFEVPTRSHHFEDFYSVNDTFVQGGYIYYFKSNDKLDSFFYKDVKKLTGPHEVSMSGFHLATKGISLSEFKSSDVWKVEIKLPMGFSRPEHLSLEQSLKEMSDKNLNLNLKEYCYSVGLTYVNIADNQVKGCFIIGFRHSDSIYEIDPTSYETSQINPK